MSTDKPAQRAVKVRKFRMSRRTGVRFFAPRPLPKNILQIGNEVMEFSREPREGENWSRLEFRSVDQSISVLYVRRDNWRNDG